MGQLAFPIYHREAKTDSESTYWESTYTVSNWLKKIYDILFFFKSEINFGHFVISIVTINYGNFRCKKGERYQEKSTLKIGDFLFLMFKNTQSQLIIFRKSQLFRNLFDWNIFFKDDILEQWLTTIIRISFLVLWTRFSVDTRYIYCFKLHLTKLFKEKYHFLSMEIVQKLQLRKSQFDKSIFCRRFEVGEQKLFEMDKYFEVFYRFDIFLRASRYNKKRNKPLSKIWWMNSLPHGNKFHCSFYEFYITLAFFLDFISQCILPFHKLRLNRENTVYNERQMYYI